MKDQEGNILTTDESIRKEAVKHYTNVFQDKPMEENIRHTKEQREELCERRLEIARKTKTPPWTTDDVKYVLKHLNQKYIKIHRKCQMSFLNWPALGMI